MKIQYLGTGAAERIPGIFCDCDVCRRAMQAGGKNIMTRSQALIDDTILIDFASDTYEHFFKLGRTLAGIEHVFVTHSHEDHLSIDDMPNRCAGMAYNLSAPKLKMYMSREVIEQVRRRLDADILPIAEAEKYYTFVPLEYYKPVTAAGYTVTPLPARHKPPEQTFVFLIEKDGKSIFYGNDTGIFGEEIDDYLAEKKKHIDILSLDCTKGDREQDYYVHMSMRECRTIADRFLARGIIDAKTQIVMTHFSHNCGMIYDELVAAAKKYGFTVAYDGRTVEA